MLIFKVTLTVIVLITAIFTVIIILEELIILTRKQLLSKQSNYIKVSTRNDEKTTIPLHTTSTTLTPLT